MKLSENTLAVLKSYHAINQSILIRPGNTLRSISPTKTLMTKIDVNENFDKEFAIYDLSKLLGLISMFDDPDLVFEDNYITIKDGTNSVRYVYAAPETIVAAPDKEVKLPSVDASATLTAEQISTVLKAAGVLGVQDITIRGDGSTLSIIAHDKKNDTSNQYALEVGQTDLLFNVDFKADNFKMISDDYEVSISSKMISQFEGKTTGASYWLACESTSSFG